MQYRKGPSKVRIWGIAQPLSDALKLFSKRYLIPKFRNPVLFFISPVLALTLILILWNVLPFKEIESFRNYSIFIILIFLRLGIYPLYLAGWASNRKYSILGALRGIAQTLTYEINLTLVLFILILSSEITSIYELLKLNFYSFYIFPIFIVFIFTLILLIIETNRTPFDFAEGESELVSGFNTEYRSGTFALIFLAEYARILFFRVVLRNLIFLYSSSSLLNYFFMVSLRFTWIWIRATFPRYRYDLIIIISWKNFLPLFIALTFFFISLKTL